jgi:vacuolar-type H+-ATPase subunit C/Vma6
LSQTTRYASVLAKMGAERSAFLSANKLNALAESSSLTELTSQLREATYQEQVAKLPPQLSSRKLERAFNESLIETYIKIIKNSPKTVAAFIRLYLVRFEVENIKALIKASNAKLGPEQKLEKLYLSAEGYLKHRSVMEEAAKAIDVKQTVSSLRSMEYTSALSDGLRMYEQNSSTTCLDVLLDKYLLEKLYDAYLKLPKNEKLHAEFYVSTEIDGFVLLTLLRGKNLGYDPDWLRLVVPSVRFKLSDDNVEAVVLALDFDTALKIAVATPYTRFFVRAQTAEETLANTEKAFIRAVFEHARGSRFTEIFNIGSVLSFLTQKQVEVHNLVVASLGIEAALNPEEIKRQMLY